MTGEQGTLLAAGFIIPILCCLIAVGALASLALPYPPMDQEQQSDQKKEQLPTELDHSFRNDGWNLESTKTDLQGPLHALDEKLSRIKDYIRQLKNERKELSEAQSSVEDLRVRLSSAENENKHLNSELYAMEKKHNEKRNIFSVTGLSGGSVSHMRPATFVECVAQGIIIQPQGSRLSKDPDQGEQRTFLSALRNTRYAVFLIRPDGFDSFRRYHALALSANESSSDPLDIGYEPVNADWQLIYPGRKGGTYAKYEPK